MKTTTIAVVMFVLVTGFAGCISAVENADSPATASSEGYQLADETTHTTNLFSVMVEQALVIGELEDLRQNYTDGNITPDAFQESITTYQNRLESLDDHIESLEFATEKTQNLALRGNAEIKQAVGYYQECGADEYCPKGDDQVVKFLETFDQALTDTLESIAEKLPQNM